MNTSNTTSNTELKNWMVIFHPAREPEVSIPVTVTAKSFSEAIRNAKIKANNPNYRFKGCYEMR